VGRFVLLLTAKKIIKIIISKGDQFMSATTERSVAKTSVIKSEPTKLLRRIGSTTVEVTVHFSNTNNETLEDKLLRLMEREVRNCA
jgi:hypothetical protein